MNHNSRDDEGVEADHEVNSPKNLTMGQHWLGKTKPTQAFSSS